MDRATCLKLAKEAGIWAPPMGVDSPSWELDLERFAALVAAAEREACARLHEQIDPACSHEREHGNPGAGAMATVIAYRDAIRARGEAGKP